MVLTSECPNNSCTSFGAAPFAKAKQMSFNKVSIIRLLDNFTESEVAQGLHLATLSIDKDFSSLSYFIPYIKKANSIN